MRNQFPQPPEGDPVLRFGASLLADGTSEPCSREGVRADDFGTLVSDRRLQDLRMVVITTSEDGNDVSAFCDMHLWASVPGPISIALEARCPACLAEIEIAQRRVWIIRHCGMDVWLHLLRSADAERR
jgi:hypothetical protein